MIQVADWLSDLLMLVLCAVALITFTVYALRFKHIWLGACNVPLLWFGYYYLLQFLELDNESFLVMRMFRPILAMLIIFFVFFVARDRVDSLIKRIALWVWQKTQRVIAMGRIRWTRR